MFWKYLFYFFLAYSLYQLIFKFILPIYRTTRQIKKGFREMQERMNGQPGQQPNPYQNTSAPTNTENNKQVGDYIDFEEIKE
jgi:hypothetical protein